MKSTKTKPKSTAKGGARISLESWLEATALRGLSVFVYRTAFVPAKASPSERAAHGTETVRHWERRGFQVLTGKTTIGAALAAVRPGQVYLVTGCGRGLPLRIVGMRPHVGIGAE